MSENFTKIGYLSFMGKLSSGKTCIVGMQVPKNR